MATVSFTDDGRMFEFKKQLRDSRHSLRHYDVVVGSEVVGSVCRMAGAWRITGETGTPFASRVEAAREIIRRKSINVE